MPLCNAGGDGPREPQERVAGKDGTAITACSAGMRTLSSRRGHASCPQRCCPASGRHVGSAATGMTSTWFSQGPPRMQAHIRTEWRWWRRQRRKRQRQQRQVPEWAASLPCRAQAAARACSCNPGLPSWQTESCCPQTQTSRSHRRVRSPSAYLLNGGSHRRAAHRGGRPLVPERKGRRVAV